MDLWESRLKTSSYLGRLKTALIYVPFDWHIWNYLPNAYLRGDCNTGSNIPLVNCPSWHGCGLPAWLFLLFWNGRGHLGWHRCRKSIMCRSGSSAAIFLLSVRPRRRDSEGGDQELGLASGAIRFQAAAAEGVRSLACHMAPSHNEGH